MPVEAKKLKAIEEEKDFPKLMVSIKYGYVVLFNECDRGLVVCKGSYSASRVGSLVENANPKHYEDYDEVIVLKNL